MGKIEIITCDISEDLEQYLKLMESTFNNLRKMLELPINKLNS